eukprot:CAMPEP_0118887670 /NCGR_PEP_ID=MMETSP1163-20130328/25299_1 /TAXON_ID=124430 /ORGANISM="Phaeomonas parva, Strain CCMP2877" /LENGTH=210 /DNA_ID=CAMNT_0006826165 /DNA_START=214 /DNA_END=846 /DNA_ORIENTATION=+
MVARKKTVLAEYTNTRGNFPAITVELLGKIRQEDHRMSVTQDQYAFHYEIAHGITYLCLSDDVERRRVAFAFLEEMQQNFDTTYGDRAQTAIAYGMSEFGNALQRLMAKYNDPGNDSLGQVQQRLADVKDVMVQNIDAVLERGERLEVLVDKSDHLNQEAFMFKQSSRQLKNAMFWRKVKIYLLITFVVGIVILFLCMMICNPDFSACKN